MPPPPQPSITNEAVQWYSSVPPVTKALITLSIVLTVAPALSLFNISYLILYWHGVLKLQLWRLITAFFVNRINISFAMNIFFLYRYSNDLETQVFLGRTADYIYFHLIVGIIQLVAAYFLELYVLSDGLLLAVAYLWSQHNKETMMTFMFGLRFKALYLPWVLVAYDLLSSGALPWASLAGIGACHIYYYLTSLPSQGGRNYLATPRWLTSMYPAVNRGTRGFATGSMGGIHAPAQQRQQQPQQSSIFGNSWGRGQRLGT
ncbi:Der1-like family-domain-containing protein [Phycomyces nitens]|nr:Der1-like family-domain-containing protein [Phycomyces nitens]